MASGESSDINGKEYKILLYVPDVEVAQLNVDTCLYEPFLTAYLDDEEDDEEDDPEAENEDDSEASGLYLLSDC